MKDEIVTFETAKLAKEKGFDWTTAYYYQHSLTEQVDPEHGTSGAFGWKKGETNLCSDYFINNHEGCDYPSKHWFNCSAPTQSLLQKWLREVHSIYVTALPYRSEETELCWYYSLVQDSEELDLILCNEIDLGASNDNYDTHEEVLEQGLQKALELI